MHVFKRIPLNLVSFITLLIIAISFFSFGRMWEATYKKNLNCICRQKYFKASSQERFTQQSSVDCTYFERDKGLVSSSKQLLSITKRIARANRYTRSGRANKELGIALRQIQSLLSNSYKNYTDELMKPKSFLAKNNKLEICPENYMGMRYGFPFYQKGFVLENCKANPPPITSLVTIGLVLYFGTMPDNMATLLHGIENEYPGITVIIGMIKESSQDENFLTKLVRNFSKIYVKLEIFTFLHSESHMWKQMAESVTTKYFLVGRRLTHFLPDSKLDRLVRVANYTRADIVGGSHRDDEGFWSHGCYQSSMRNYAFHVEEGYDLSYNSCIYCDYLSGPFLIKPQILAHYLSLDIPDGTLIWLDFFEKIKVQSQLTALSCPDSMFLTHSNQLSLVTYRDWLHFAQAWELDFIKIPDKEEMAFDKRITHRKCGYGIHGEKGESVPPACLKELSDMLLAFINLAEASDIRYMVKGGTAIGAIKFFGVLPWERDEDVYFHALDYEKVLNLSNSLSQMDYFLDIDSIQTNYSDCVQTFMNNSFHENDRCGVLALKTGNWRIQLYGVPYMDESYWQEKYKIRNVTKVRFEGRWVNAPFNPLNYARNFYGDDIFAHVEHWVGQGRNDWWNPLQSGKFQKCPRPGFHGCLENFLPTGTLQFKRTLL